MTLNPPGIFDIYHAQDCISANALWRVQQQGLIREFVRTIHHIDEFTSPSLVKCQNDSVYRPTYRIVVSDYWQGQLAEEFKMDSTVINNGVDVDRFRPASGR